MRGVLLLRPPPCSPYTSHPIKTETATPSARTANAGLLGSSVGEDLSFVLAACEALADLLGRRRI
jgi:hypothetical protein